MRSKRATASARLGHDTRSIARPNQTHPNISKPVPNGQRAQSGKTAHTPKTDRARNAARGAMPGHSALLRRSIKSDHLVHKTWRANRRRTVRGKRPAAPFTSSSRTRNSPAARPNHRPTAETKRSNKDSFCIIS